MAGERKLRRMASELRAEVARRTAALAVEDEDVARVHRVALARHLGHRDVARAPLDAEQPRRPHLGLDLLEAGGDAALEVLDGAALEVLEELGALVVLDLAVLHRVALQVVVELDRLVRRRAVLVLRRLGADPEVRVVRQLVRVRRVLDVGVEHDVAVADVEAAVLRLGPRHDAELLDPPHLQAHLLAAAGPLRLAVRRRLLTFSIDVAANEVDVGVLPVGLAVLDHGGEATCSAN